MDLIVPPLPGSLPHRIYRGVIAMIEDGRLCTGDVLPASRTLATQLGVSRTTVTAAYDRLTGEGYTTARQGQGTVVAARAAARPNQGRRVATPSQEMPDPPRPVTANTMMGMPDPHLFPFAPWRRAMADALQPRRELNGLGRGPQGHPLLRAALVRHLAMSRSVVTATEHVVITAGAQQAFFLLAQVLRELGATIAVEDPGYPFAHQAFAAGGLTLAKVRVDGEGLVVGEIPEGVRIVYVTPSHQMPTATTMSLERRSALLAWADRVDGVIVEDDYDSEYRYVGRPLEPLHRLDAAHRVAYVGSFSKTMQPGMRVGYVALPPRWVEPVCAARDAIDRHGDPVTEAALATLIESGVYARHLRRARRVYDRRKTALVEALRMETGAEAVVNEPAAGLHLRVDLVGVAPGAAARVVRRATELGAPLADLWLDGAAGGRRESLYVGFGALRDEDVPRAAALIARALREAS